MEIAVDEVLKEVKLSKNCKAPGLGAINNEILKCEGGKLVS